MTVLASKSSGELGEAWRGGVSYGCGFCRAVCPCAERYRLQSDSFAVLALFLVELEERLRTHLAKEVPRPLPPPPSSLSSSSPQEPALVVSHSGPLPLTEYFDLIDSHFTVRAQPCTAPGASATPPPALPRPSPPPQLRRNVEQCGVLLSRHAQQFRSIQKRLLTRFKDKTPVGLAHLDTLLDGTHMQVWPY